MSRLGLDVSRYTQVNPGLSLVLVQQKLLDQLAEAIECMEIVCKIRANEIQTTVPRIDCERQCRMNDSCGVV